MLPSNCTSGSPNTQSPYPVFYYELNDYRIAKAVHLTFYAFPSLGVVQARDKKRAANSELLPVQLIIDPLNSHRPLRLCQARHQADQHQTLRLRQEAH
jgi:hypothetical protein